MVSSHSLCRVAAAAMAILGFASGCGLGYEDPTFYTAQGTAVWTHGISGITNEAVSDAITLFVEEMRSTADEQRLLEMFDVAAVEFTEDPIEYGGELYSGLQNGNYLTVVWRDGFASNAFFHEAMHLMRADVLSVDVDREHRDANFWRVAGQLKNAYAERI